MVALYRKYRPQNFSQFIGQEETVKVLKNSIEAGTISHAYLFYGPRGTGKTSLARILTKAINCQSKKSSEPCGRCLSCQEISEGRSIDLIEIDAASNRGIDEIRSLKDGISVVPVKSKYKTYIIDEAHQLTREASNALLKTLEEPPSHAIFVLCTTEFYKMLPTIVSRCQKFEFKNLSLEEIKKKLRLIAKNENLYLKEEVLELIAKNARGSIRDAESLLEEVINFQTREIKKEEVEKILGLASFESQRKLVELIAKKNEKEILNLLWEIQKSGISAEKFFEGVLDYFHNLLVFKISPEILKRQENLTTEEKENLKEQSNLFSREEIEKILKIFLSFQNQIKWSENSILPLKIAILESVGSLK